MEGYFERLSRRRERDRNRNADVTVVNILSAGLTTSSTSPEAELSRVRHLPHLIVIPDLLDILMDISIV
jgi:hypothetical protein